MDRKQIQRPLNAAMKTLIVGTLPAAPKRAALSGDDNIARSGAPKRTVDAPISPGMKRQTSGELHPYLHGVTVEDEPNVPLKSHERAIPLHPSTPARVAAAVHPVANDPGEILRDAARLGRPQPKPAEKA